MKKPDHEQRMEETTAVLAGTLLTGLIIFLVIYSLPDWQWVIDYGFDR